MRSSDLQIGDWVRYHSKLIKVTSLYAKPTKEGDFVSNEVGWSYDVSTWVDGDFIEPIPLTPEILERNGFRYFEDANAYILMTDDLNCVVLTLNGLTVIFHWHDIPIMCVHQLQHILRICGLNDLADNLKLEE